MKLAFSSNAYMHFSIEDTIAKIADLGYTGIEILADVPHAWPSFLLDERKDSIRQSLERAGLEIANINAFMMNAVADPRQPYWHPGWTDPDPHYRAIRREHPADATRQQAPSGQFTEQTIFAVVVDVAEVLVLHTPFQRSPRCSQVLLLTAHTVQSV